MANFATSPLEEAAKYLRQQCQQQIVVVVVMMSRKPATPKALEFLSRRSGGSETITAECGSVTLI